jgi:hypothetical protein
MPGKHRWAGVAAPTQRNTTPALDRARRASDVINISNYAGEDNTLWLLTQPARTAAATGAPARTAAGGRPPRGRGGRVLAVIGPVFLSWLGAIPRRLGDRLFTMNDTEAYWESWQITKTHGGLGRRYRDLRFDTLAECPKCRGSGGTADLSCPPCLGTGRVTLGEVS